MAPSSARRPAPFAAWLILAALVGTILLAPVAAAQSTQVQYWDTVAVTATIQPDSTFQVVERQGFVFEQGTFNGSFRDIDTARLAGIGDVGVSEEGFGPYREDHTPLDLANGVFGPPHTFQVIANGGQKRIIWFYGRLAAPARKTMIIQYTVSGALRFYPGGDQFWWNPFLPTRQARIEHATLTVQVPANVNLADPAARVAIYPDGAGMSQVAAQQAIFTFNGPLAPGAAVEARIQWPHGLVSGSPAPWQVAEDQERASREQIELQIQQNRGWVVLLSFGLVLLVGLGGTLFWVWRWYSAGRDPVAGLVADYLPDPPATLPAGLVGVLVDESADQRDVIATILDLGRKGNLRIQEVQPGQNKDFQYTLLNGQTEYPHEAAVIGALFGAHDTTVLLSDLKDRFYARLPEIYATMYDAVVRAGYFPSRPDQRVVRYRWQAAAFLLLAALAMIPTFCAFAVTPAACLIPPAFALPGIVGLALAGSLRRKTPAGAEQAARWRAFGRYLESLTQYGNVGQAAARFNDFLPYAVALGLEREYVNQFNNVRSSLPPPLYYFPLDPGYGSSGWGNTAGGAFGNPAGAGHAPPGSVGPDQASWDLSPGGINAANIGIVNTIEGFNNSLIGMINDAGSVFTSTPQSSSGGWSGGGSSWSSSDSGSSSSSSWSSSSSSSDSGSSDSGSSSSSDSGSSGDGGGGSF